MRINLRFVTVLHPAHMWWGTRKKAAKKKWGRGKTRAGRKSGRKTKNFTPCDPPGRPPEPPHTHTCVRYSARTVLILFFHFFFSIFSTCNIQLMYWMSTYIHDYINALYIELFKNKKNLDTMIQRCPHIDIN